MEERDNSNESENAVDMAIVTKCMTCDAHSIGPRSEDRWTFVSDENYDSIVSSYDGNTMISHGYCRPCGQAALDALN